jgi:hypothetical protein
MLARSPAPVVLPNPYREWSWTQMDVVSTSRPAFEDLTRGPPGLDRDPRAVPRTATRGILTAALSAPRDTVAPAGVTAIEGVASSIEASDP